MNRPSNELGYNYRMITLGRESRGLSQTALAAQTCISQGKISKVESGLLALTNEELNVIAQCLQYPVHFFQREHRLYGAGLGEFFHRKKQSVSQKQLNKIYAKIEVRRIELIQLLQAVDIGQSHFFQFDLDQVDGRVEEVAKYVRATWRIPRGPIDNVVEMIEEAGGLVIPFDFEGLKIDAISILTPELPPLFFINMNRPMDRIRFTLCHEIGHIIMHSIPNGSITDIEEQADRFASELLLPSAEIGPSLDHLMVNRLPALKAHWKVSMASLVMTAKNLGRISPSKARYLWTQLSNAGYRTHEPAHLEPAREMPQLLDKVIQIYSKELEYDLKDLSHVVGLSETECKSLYFHSPHLKLVD